MESKRGETELKFWKTEGREMEREKGKGVQRGETMARPGIGCLAYNGEGLGDSGRGNKEVGKGKGLVTWEVDGRKGRTWAMGCR